MEHWNGADRFHFPAQDAPDAHQVFVKGEGRPILILQELPGFGERAIEFAERLIAKKFRVYFPHLLGPLGKGNNLQAGLNVVRNYCVRREFHFFTGGRQSPIADWMRDLCAEISTRENGAKIGVLGMCLTGSFAIPLIAEPSVAGAVASQPSLPFWPGKGAHMNDEDIKRANNAMSEKGCALAMRYRKDWLSRQSHLDALKSAFGENIETETYDDKSGKFRIMPAHALMTVDFHDDAFNRMVTYFDKRL